MKSKQPNIFWVVALPIGFYFFMAFLYLFAIPVGESPDEPGHIQCVEQVSILGRVPIVDPEPRGAWWSREFIISGRMCYHMPLYYLLSGALQRGVAMITNQPLVKFEFPPSNPESIRPMFLHGAAGSFWHVQDSLPLLAVRFFSILLSAGVVVGAYKTARVLYPGKQSIGSMSILLIAGWPQFVFMSRAINNDSLATAVAVLIFVLMLHQVGNPQRYILAALLAVIGVLSKLTVTFTIGVILASWCIEILFYKNLRRNYLLVLLTCLALWASAFWLLNAHPILSEKIQVNQITSSNIPERATQLSYWGDVFLLTLSSGWARFGWMDIATPMWHAYLWWAFIGSLFLIGLASLIRNANNREKRWQIFFIILWLFGVFLSFIRINITVFQPQFRFAWASLPPLSVLAASGWQIATQKFPSWDKFSPVFLYLFFFLYNVWIMQGILGDIYNYG